MVTISDWNDLDAVRNDLTADYTLENDLDSSTAGYSGIGDDFKRIGFDGTPFSGTFNGQGYAIRDFVLGDDGGANRGHGLFGYIGDGGLVENLSLSGTVDVIGFTADVGAFIGGLAGNVGASGSGTVQNCASHVDVTAGSTNYVGGLVGRNNDTITDSYATGAVDGNAEVGGLVGDNYYKATLIDSYATGSVSGSGRRVGGLVGKNYSTIQTSYAVGSVTGDTDVGALVGYNEIADELSDSYADEETTGQTSLTGDGLGPTTNSYTLTTSEMQGDEASNSGNMDGFDYTSNWKTVLSEDSDASDDGYPILQSADRIDQLKTQGIYVPPPPSAPSNLSVSIN